MCEVRAHLLLLQFRVRAVRGKAELRRVQENEEACFAGGGGGREVVVDVGVGGEDGVEEDVLVRDGTGEIRG